MAGKRNGTDPILTRVGNCESAVSLADSLREMIDSGAIPAGYRLPTIRDFVSATPLSQNMVLRALGMLATEGWVEQQRGSGTFVLEKGAESESKKGGNRLIGVIPPYHSSEQMHFFASEILHGIWSQSAPRRHRIEIIHNEDNEVMQWEFADRVLDLGVDGIIWIQPRHESTISLARLVEANVHMVFTGREFAELPVPVVRDDVQAFGDLVADYLVENGRKELLCLVGRQDDLHTSLRIDALRRSLASHGIGLPDDQVLTVTPTSKWRSLYTYDPECMIRALLARHPRFDAVFTIHAHHLEPFVELHAGGQWTCPEDFLAIHFEQSIRPIRESWPQIPFTLVRPPLEDIGRQAVRVLESLWGLEDPEASASKLECILDECGSRWSPAKA